jgi:hypothetical protein
VRPKLEEENVRPKYIFRLTDPGRVKWDLFVMSLAIWNCFSIPFVIAFKPKEADHPAMVTFDSLIDFLFIIDILICFRTSYLHASTGEEIMDPN